MNRRKTRTTSQPIPPVVSKICANPEQTVGNLWSIIRSMGSNRPSEGNPEPSNWLERPEWLSWKCQITEEAMALGRRDSGSNRPVYQDTGYSQSAAPRDGHTRDLKFGFCPEPRSSLVWRGLRCHVPTPAITALRALVLQSEPQGRGRAEAAPSRSSIAVTLLSSRYRWEFVP
jgi:hypothetical protein